MNPSGKPSEDGWRTESIDTFFKLHQYQKTLLLASLVVFTLGLCLSLSSLAQNLRDPFLRWRPTHELAGVRYVGSNACAQCHAAQTAKRLANSMSRALAPIESCDVLKTQTRLSFRNGTYNYQIVREGNRSSYTISNSLNSISEPI